MIAGSRESALAMKQTEMFRDRLTAAGFPACEIKGITSHGDIDLATSLKDMGGTGVFVRELDEALLNGEVDVTVNSLKDIPAELTPGLVIGALLPRDDVRDALVPVGLDDLGCGAIVGTSSVRREMILRTVKPAVRTKPIRGNIQTRLRKVQTEEYTATIMAMAGLDRLGLADSAHPLDKHVFIPAAGQGAIAVECRADDTQTLAVLKKLDDTQTRTEVHAERTILRLMNAGCSSPIGINAEVTDDQIHLIAISFDYSVRPIRVDTTFAIKDTDQELPRIADILLGREGRS